MNILILSWKDIKNPDSGGAELVTFEFAKRLVNEGNQVTIFCRKFSNSQSVENIDGIRIYRKGNALTTYFHAWRHYKKLNPKPDLVIDMLNTIFWQTPLYVPKSKRLAYVNQLAREVLFYELRPPISWIAYLLEYLQFISYKTTQVLCFSNSTREDLLKIGLNESNIHMFPLGIDPKKYRQGQKTEFPLFLCVNRLVRMKRTDLAIKAISILKRQFPQVKLHIIGRGYEKEKLESLVHKLNLQNNVSFDFKANDKEKVKFMSQAWALIFPSVKEGWGITVTESAACGTPTIASRVSGLVDSVQEGKNGIFVSKNPSPEELAQAMEKIISNDALRKQSSEDSIKLSKKYSWDESFRVFYSLINHLYTNQRKNLLILSWRGPKHYNSGGAEMSVHEHAKAWSKAGMNVTLFTSQVIGLKATEIIDGVKIIRQGRQIFGVQLRALLYYFKNKESIDLLVDNFHGVPFFTPLYTAKPKIAFIHEVAKEVWFLNYLLFPLNYIFGLIGYILEPIIFRFIYTKIPFITVSNSTKQDLLIWGIPEENINVIHNGVTLHKVDQNISKERVKILMFLGEISRDKGTEDAIYVFSKLVKEDKMGKLWIVGKGSPPYIESMKKLIDQLNLKEKVRLWGFVSDKKKFELLKMSHILIHPSLREGWGQVVIEAAAMGTPTVGYKVAGLKDSILDGKTGLLSEINIDDLTRKIEKLIYDDKLYKQMQVNCIEWSKQFVWKKATEQSLKLVRLSLE